MLVIRMGIGLEAKGGTVLGDGFLRLALTRQGVGKRSMDILIRINLACLAVLSNRLIKFPLVQKCRP